MATVLGTQAPAPSAPALPRVAPGALVWLAVAGFASIALQRISFTIGGGQISAASLVLLLTWVVLLAVFRWPVSAGGLVGYFLILAIAATTAVLNAGSDPSLPISVPSLLLIVTAYLPLLLVVRPSGVEGAGRVYARGLLWAVRIGAALALVQAVLMWSGLGFWDPFASLPDAIVASNFNSAYDTTYVASNFGFETKPNGVIFLEPSFVSLWCCFGLVLEAYRWHERRSTGGAGLGRLVWVLVLAAAVAVSISASGFVVLGVAALPLLWRYRDRPLVILGAAVVIAGAFASGFLGPITAKLLEGTSGDTSTNLRLVAPYQLLAPLTADSPLWGHGPGTADRLAGQFGLSGLQTTTIVKAALEYGWPFVVALLGVALLRAFVGGPRCLGLTLAALGVWLIPSEALLGAPVLALVLFLAPNVAAAGRARRAGLTDQTVL
ncbi:hypothetical protein [Cellulomonas marina]|uniref:O-antigen ligase like membrane protein n=1 Tax=Cellulomonas marina TaxID=988821 RepID=A0A1I0X0K9_9CELL|nr:hypothetical protein [Cellulomonas marina]GIG29364.1 hypothetical protein Cma02nite_19640 [Cellulomonas marina]SFA94552.1 hypothetical protein SAMN05421867_10441 [Cellulomonas marina]